MTEGTKYHPLFEHLLFSGQGHLPMSFAEIEGVLGAPLPPSAWIREEWWSNSPSGHSQARAWLRAGYLTSRIDLKGQKVDFTLEGWPERFRRVERGRLKEDSVETTGMAEAAQTSFDPSHAGEHPEPAGQVHPLFGIWVGQVTLVPGYDYTKPAFEPDAAP